MNQRLGWLGSLLLLAVCGCRTVRDVTPASQGVLVEPGLQTALPRWYTQPQGAEQTDAPVCLGMGLPAQLQDYGRAYQLPAWVIYGTVRALGAEETVVRGDLKIYRMNIEGGASDSYVENSIYYYVPRQKIEAALRGIAAECAAAKTPAERQAKLGRHLRTRTGAYLLFSLAPLDNDHQLAESYATNIGAVETFRTTTNAASAARSSLPIGWRESASEYLVTVSGPFSYADPFEFLRRTEEKAIQELTVGVAVKFSHSGRQADLPGGGKKVTNVNEEAVRQDVALSLHGLRIVRRALDLDLKLCLVTIAIPKNGVVGAK